MSFRSLKFVWIVGAMSALLSVHGQQPPPRRGQPIIFSAPRQETVTSNLNEIVTQNRRFPNLGEEFKKPSNISDVGDPGANNITLPLRQLPPPNVTSKHLKELYDKREKRNDRAYQTPEDLVTGLTAEEIFKIPDLGPDGQEKKKTTGMERYYQRLEREQSGNSNTNQMKGDDLFDRQKQNDDRDDPAFAGAQTPSSPSANLTVPSLKPLFGSDSIAAFSTDMNKPRSWSENLGFANVEPPEVTKARETRLENFKQLLDSGAMPPVASGAPNLFNSTPAAAQGFNPSRALDSLPGATPSSSLSLPRTIVGAPVGFGGNHQIVTPPPPARLPLPPPAFEVPKRKF